MFRRLKEDLYEDIKGLILSNVEDIKVNQAKECNKLCETISEKLSEQLSLRQNEFYIALSTEIARQLQEVQNHLYVNVSEEMERQLVYRMESLKQELEFRKEEKAFFYKILEQFYSKDDLSYFQLMNIYESLQDRQSQDLFMSLLEVSLSKSYKRLFEHILAFSPRDLKPNDLIKIIRHNQHQKKDKIILAPYSDWTRKTYRILNELGISVDGFFDNQEMFQGEKDSELEGLDFYTETQSLPKDALYIIENNVFSEYKAVLSQKMIDSSRLVQDISAWQNEYFIPEILQLGEHEVFIDAGAYTGDTISQFLEYVNNQYDKIIAFEPDESNFWKCQEYIKKWESDKIQLYHLGLWNRNQRLNFDSKADMSSSIDAEGNYEVDVVALDNFLGIEQRISLVKMDIEGAELKALQGMQQLIKANKPKLAISIYHKAEDIIAIPLYLKQLNPDYKFYLRHSNSYIYDSILFAV